MDSVFIYWDNSNIFHEAQRLAEERGEGPNARYRVRIHFDHMLCLAHADRPLKKALAAGQSRRKCVSYGTGWKAKELKSNCSTAVRQNVENRKCLTESCSYGCWKMHWITTVILASW